MVTRRFYYSLVIFLFLIFGRLSAQIDTTILKIPYSNQNVTIDGDLSDWDTFFQYSFEDTLYEFNNTTGIDLNDIFPSDFDFSEILPPKSRNRIQFRSFWNMNYIYLAVSVWDKHLFAEIDGRIDKPMIHLNDGIEIYIDSKNDSQNKMDINDYQFLIDINNNFEVFKGDLKEILTDTVAVPKDYAQNILFNSKTSVFGKVNDDTFLDSLFIVEIAIPFAAIGIVPNSGHKMRLDVCINDIDYPVQSTMQIEEVSTAMWPFNWSGYSDFGYPQYWKIVQFVGEPTWFEQMSEKYKESWLWIYALTLMLSIIVIGLLFYRTIKLKQIPIKDELLDEKFIFIQSPEEKDQLSFNEKILKNASDYIVKNKSEFIHSEDVAKAIGITLRNFQRITKMELNLTPTNYIYVIKLNLAADFLKNNEGNVTDAAYEFGFSDPSYFSKIFKKHFNISPSEYVKELNKQ